ncbi:HEAT repeat domain-containing protein [Pedobacter aquatilis]|uniref:HEAT repeat domain-containing protein n=1 Tax=Pedobacter aquatilis TaxID=351343 RepID=UPI00292DC804|nr:HEAT repeat domain-containing protein [Pedobacter aquatilis]
MNDPIKEFVAQNRAAFDELEAPAFNLEGFKARMKQPEPEKKVKKLWPATKWMVAASVLLVAGAAFLILRIGNTTSSTEKLVQQVKKQPMAMPQEDRKAEPVIALQEQEKEHIVFASNVKHVKPKFRVMPQPDAMTNVYAKLSDSSSSSTRLAAILELDKSGQVSNDVMNRLASTLNHDENSNVRLAALSVLEKYSYDAHVSALLVRSLNTQSDPMVQLGLVNLLGKMKNLNINDKLYALANDPNTFDAVKDEAYSLLLKEDKL